MKIVVTTDGSERSLAALPHAARLANALDGELVLARILDPLADCHNVVMPTLSEAVAALRAHWMDELAAVLARHGAAGRGIVPVRARGEEIRDSILRVAAEERADILAMSTRGSGTLRHVLLGSVALGVLGASTTPVLVTGDHIVSPPTSEEYRILVTSDGSPDSARAVEAAIDLVRAGRMPVTLVRVCEPAVADRGDTAEVLAAADELKAIQQRFPDPSAVETVVRTIVMLGGVDTAIVDTAREVNASAIAISTHGHSARHHIVAGSVAMGILRQSHLPVLLVQSGPRLS